MFPERRGHFNNMGLIYNREFNYTRFFYNNTHNMQHFFRRIFFAAPEFVRAETPTPTWISFKGMAFSFPLP